jgi:histone-lysine N-methyltransferase SETMAR
MISSEKLMVTITWNPSGFQVIEVVPKRQKSNADYYCSSVLTKLPKMAKQFRSKTRRKMILHADNARPHTAKSSIEFCAKLHLRVAPHPPYSPGLAPPDCFLFGYIKNKLKGLSFPSALHLHRAIKQTV